MPDTTMPPALAFMLAARRCELQGLESLAVTCELVTCISRLVHALQKERGYGNIYLGGQAPHYLQQLDAHTGEAQAVEQQVRACFERIDPSNSGADRARLFNRIAYVLHALDDLPGLRRRVREHQIDGKTSTAAFTRLIGGLLAVVFEAADTAADPSITRALVAMFNFMQGKELAGQERAAGVAGFSAGRFTGELIDSLQHLSEAQVRCFDTFLEFSDLQMRKRWQALQGSDTLAQIARLRGIAEHTAHSGLQVEPALCEVWFELNTQRIDTMKEVENHLADDLLERCQRCIKQAHADLENHRTLLKRLADLDGQSGQAVLFSVQGSSLDSPPQDGLGQQVARSVLDLLHEQNHRLQGVSDELREARQTLDERKLIEQAKKRLMEEGQLSEEEAYSRLRKRAMERGMRLVDLAQALLKDEARAPARSRPTLRP
ncbi:ANTAR domain-containing protein [Pseudomonas cuatrocienegasensis]|uniref:ANTAR domain-containing protein n=1 Tax=Pseudomonas cuatrocienegasensis TaxID=543360 RepID=A0ABY1BD11_9PSED|nr:MULTISPECIES: nitrate- and nitrite sensing domain-containing protein [Pseudomonas]OEC33940.1 transcription antitermination regulator [Pseudomonas sp. 21C1]SEQ57139.1 ANTAR domain-containing protein [Pseudomonas cuatrocienegasensis]